MAAISLGTLTDLEKVDYVREGLPFAKPKLVHQQFGQKDRVQARQGKTRQWFRMTKATVTSGSDFTGSATYVDNSTGTPPTFTPATPADTTVSATVSCLFGKGHSWYEAADYTSFADLPKELRGLNWQHAAEAVDTKVRGVINAGTTVGFANARSSRPNLLSTDQIDMNDIFNSVVTLRDNDAPEISGMYSVIASNSVIAQLMKDTTFQSAIQMQKPYIFSGTIAELYGCRFVATSRASTTTNAGSASQLATVEQTLIVGQGAYGVTHWGLDDFDIIYTPPGGHSDEWKVTHSITWKMYIAAVILNQNWMLRLESARA